MLGLIQDPDDRACYWASVGVYIGFRNVAGYSWGSTWLDKTARQWLMYYIKAIGDFVYMKRSCLSPLSAKWKTLDKVVVFHMHAVLNWDIYLLNIPLNKLSLVLIKGSTLYGITSSISTSVKSSKRLRSYHILSQLSLSLNDVKI